MRIVRRMEVRPLINHLGAVLVVPEQCCIRWVLGALALCLAVFWTPVAEAQTYLSYFYTPTDVIVFMPEAGTAVTLRNASGTVVWQRSSTLNAGEVENVTGLGAGWYRVTSNTKIVVMAGDMVTGSGTYTRSYYARAVDGSAVGIELYTYIRSSLDEDTPKLFVFSHQVSNSVTVLHRGEFGWETVWSGTLGDGDRQDVSLTYSDHIKITSTYPVSALVAGSEHYDDPGAHCVPATSSGTFYGDRFLTWVPGGEVYVYSFADGTHVDLHNTFTIDPTPRTSWNLNEGGVGSYAIPFDQPFAISVLATKPIVMCRIYQDLAGENGMHYIPAKSGTMIGTDFIIDANDTIEVIAYEDGTSVEYTRLNGTVHSYTLNAGQHQALLPNTAGRVIAQKAVSIVSRALIGATFVPIPVTSLDTAPGPPAVFAVRHYPPLPTVNDSTVTVSWATDEPCTSCLTYRRNSGAWTTPPCVQTYQAQHSIPINVSSFAADDVIEYSVASTDKDNNTVANTNNGQYYTFTITDDIPQLSVSRLSAFPPGSNDDAYTVNLTVQNNGIAEARNILIRERLTGMISPTAATSTVPITSRELELSIPVPNLAAGQFTTVSYDLIPMLYGTYSTFGVGLSTPSTMSYSSAVGKKFSGSFSDPHTFSSTVALNWIRGKDYAVATNIGRLRTLNTPAAAGTLLEEAARFALARDAVVAELETTNSYAIEKLVNTSWNGRLGYIGFGGWRFLLFLGCQGVIPSFNVEHKCTALPTRYAPTADNIYADVNTGDHFKPEVIIGRLPGENATLLVSQLQNSLTSMSTDRAVFMSGTGDGQDEFVDCIDDVEGWLGQYTTHVKRHWKDLADANARVSAFLADAPNTDLFIYRDHGGVDSWDGTVDTSHPSSANFGTKHPMVWSIACLTGQISGNSLAEAFLDGGASLFIGSTEVSPRGPNNDFAHYLAKYHTMSAYYPTTGEVFKWAKRKVIDENIHWYTTCYADARNKQLVNEYNLYGDPKRGEAPLSKAARAVQPVTDDGGEGPPPSEIELRLPEYVVESTEAGIDYVTFEGEEGGTYEEEGQPIVPIYLYRVAFGPEYKIREVSLVERSGLEEGEGLSLPVASFADDDGRPLPPSSPAVVPATFPSPETQYAWRVEEELDGSHVLMLTVFPFYYDSATTAVEFYRAYVFSVSWNESDTSITGIEPNEDVFELGDPVTGMIDITHIGGQSIEVLLELQLLDETSGEVVAGADPQGLGLDEGTVSVDFGIPVGGDEPATYLLRARLTSGEDVLDEETTRVRIGRLSAVGEALAVTPTPANGFEIGDPVTVAAWFQSTCASSLNGVARIRVSAAGSGAVVHEHAEDVSLDSGATQEVATVWDTSAAVEGDYLVTAALEYEGLSTDPMTEDLFTLRDMGIELSTDRQVYDVGDKVVVWAVFTGAGGESLEVTPAAWLAGPGLGPVALQLTYLGDLEIYSGWYYLAVDSPEGAYGIALTAEAQGYRTGGEEHFFSVGGAPPTPGFTWSPPAPTVDEPVQFTDTSTGEPTSWAWSFGDGGTSASQNPAHTYGEAGDWEVTLMVTNTFGTDWVTQTVTVAAGPEVPLFADGFESGDCTRWSLEVP